MRNALLRTGMITSLVLFSLLCQGFSHQIQASDMKTGEETAEESGLVILWTSGDKEVALKMVFMYTRNAIQRLHLRSNNCTVQRNWLVFLALPPVY